jgi:hypothetical protein
MGAPGSVRASQVLMVAWISATEPQENEESTSRTMSTLTSGLSEHTLTREKSNESKGMLLLSQTTVSLSTSRFDTIA